MLFQSIFCDKMWIEKCFFIGIIFLINHCYASSTVLDKRQPRKRSEGADFRSEENSFLLSKKTTHGTSVYRCYQENACVLIKCLNGGTCVVSDNIATCECASGFKGIDCSQRTGDTLQFNIAPSDRYLNRGEFHIEECKATSSLQNQVEYKWTFKGIPIAPFNKETGFGTHPGGVLQINSFNEDFEGLYSCVASSAVAEHSRNFVYTMAENCENGISQGPELQEKKVGQFAIFSCTVVSTAISMSWKKNCEYIDFSQSPRLRKLTNNYLFINDLQITDAGIYRCEAKDEHGCLSYRETNLSVILDSSLQPDCGISMTFTEQAKLAELAPKSVVNLFVKDNMESHVTFVICGSTEPATPLRNDSNDNPLIFVKAPLDRMLKRGQSLVEECIVKSPPGEEEEVKYSWTLNGQIIREFDDQSNFGSLPGGILEIRQFSGELEGIYSCLASTSSITVQHVFHYKLVGDCDVRIERGPRSETKKTGESVILQCILDSTSAQVRWKKNSVYIDFRNNPRFTLIGQRSYLRISDVQMDDAGLYQCEAEDKNGCYSYKEGELTVINVISINKYCGLSVHDPNYLARSKISGGQDSMPNENPWHVVLRYQNGQKNVKNFGGGTLISQRYVLTAAHSIVEFEKSMRITWSQDNIQLILGTSDCLGENPAGTLRRPKQYYIHPNFNTTTYDSDIALIELDNAVEFTDSIRPICLEPAMLNDRMFLDLRSSVSPSFGKVAGCGIDRSRGHSNVLKVVHLPYVQRDVCQESIGPVHTLTDNMLCAGFNVSRKGDTCAGDNGEGLMMTSGSRWVQTGIVSHGIGGCDSGRFGIYTNVGNFYSWINDIAKFTDEEVPDFLGLA